MLTRILELADPVATCADDRLRFDAFSACCSVYGRVDLLPGAYDGDILGRGTTNVDFGPAMRTALAGVQDRDRLGSVVSIRTAQPRRAAELAPLLRLVDELRLGLATGRSTQLRPVLESFAGAGGQAGRLARSILSRG